MKKLYFILEDRSRLASVKNRLESEFEVNVSLSMSHALQGLRQTRSEFLFVDIALLERAAKESSYNAVFQTLGLVSPNAAIIIMTPQKTAETGGEDCQPGGGFLSDLSLTPG